LGATNCKKSKISSQKIKNCFWGCEPKTIVEHLSAARLQSFVRASQKDFRLSSAALGLFVFQFGDAED
jgi:hypothetical protein